MLTINSMEDIWMYVFFLLFLTSINLFFNSRLQIKSSNFTSIISLISFPLSTSKLMRILRWASPIHFKKWLFNCFVSDFPHQIHFHTIGCRSLHIDYCCLNRNNFLSHLFRKFTAKYLVDIIDLIGSKMLLLSPEIYP